MAFPVAQKKEGLRDLFRDVPEGCTASIISITTPIDACRFALVSRAFHLASESEIVWQRFLPSDYDLIIARSEGGDALLTEFQKNKKHLYMRLANRDRPLLVDAASKCFWLEKRSGKKCWMIAARSLTIIWSDRPALWKWTSLPESRFPEVAELLNVCHLEIRVKINTSTLSPDTNYAAYLIFNTTEYPVGLENACNASVSTAKGENTTRTVYFGDDYKQNRATRSVIMQRFQPVPFVDQMPRVLDQIPRPRLDGWLELKIGDFFTSPDDEVELSLMEVDILNRKKGLIIEGIEVRPARRS